MKTFPLALLIPCIAFAACSRKEPVTPEVPPPVAALGTPEMATPEMATPAPASPGAAAATIRVPLIARSGSVVKGELVLSRIAGGVQVGGELLGLTAGEHGFHVHERGDCSAPDASSAGEHLNPTQTSHGGGPTSTFSHLGDLPNLIADTAGHALVNTSVFGANLRGGGPNDLVGKAFVVHAERDDHVSQPAGASGARIACGVVK